MNCAPVILIVYTRKQNLENLVVSLRQNPESVETDVWIISDAASKKEDEKAVSEVREYAKTVSGFRSVHLVAPEKNSRVYNISHYMPVVKTVLEKYGKVISLEDDNIVSKHFLHYMNEGLEFYKDYPNIGAICGYELPIKIPKEYKNDIYLGVRYSPWGVGFTKKWYDQIDRSVWNRYEEAIKPENKRKFLMAGKNIFDILKEDSEGKIYAPDARVCFYQIMHNIYCVFPCISMVKNVGFDGSGEHNGYSLRWDAMLDDRAVYSVKMVKDIQPDLKILHRIQKYNDHGYILRHYGKILLKKIGLFSFARKILYK